MTTAVLDLVGVEYRDVLEIRTNAAANADGVIGGDVDVRLATTWTICSPETARAVVQTLRRRGWRAVAGEWRVVNDKGEEIQALSRLLEQYWREAGGESRTAPNMRRAVTQTIARLEGDLLRHHLKYINAFSVNHAAENVGRRFGGAALLNRFCRERIRLSAHDYGFQNCSGLGGNAITPTAVVAVVAYLLQMLTKAGYSLQTVLPAAGIDGGTLRRRFAEDDIRGSVVAKTGTLSAASSLAGVFFTRDGGPLPFAILQAGAPAGLRVLQEDLIRTVAEYTGGPHRIVNEPYMPTYAPHRYTEHWLV